MKKATLTALIATSLVVPTFGCSQEYDASMAKPEHSAQQEAFWANEQAKLSAERKQHADRVNRNLEREKLQREKLAEERKRAAAKAQRSSERSKPQPQKYSGSYSDTLACIRKHESGNRYTLVSKTGKFRGAYMMHRDYAPTWAKRAGYGSWSGTTVDKWPPAVQDAVALHLGKSSNWRAWSDHVAYSCPRFIS